MPYNAPIRTRSIPENQLAPHILLRAGGSASSSNSPNYVDFNAVAASPVEALRPVTIQASGQISHAAALPARGISLIAGDAGDVVTVRSLGLVESADFNFTPGAELFLGAEATITETAPDLSVTGAFLQSIATAITPTVIFIYLGDFWTK